MYKLLSVAHSLPYLASNSSFQVFNGSQF